MSQLCYRVLGPYKNRARSVLHWAGLTGERPGLLRDTAARFGTTDRAIGQRVQRVEAAGQTTAPGTPASRHEVTRPSMPGENHLVRRAFGAALGAAAGKLKTNRLRCAPKNFNPARRTRLPTAESVPCSGQPVTVTAVANGRSEAELPTLTVRSPVPTRHSCALVSRYFQGSFGYGDGDLRGLTGFQLDLAVSGEGAGCLWMLSPTSLLGPTYTWTTSDPFLSPMFRRSIVTCKPPGVLIASTFEYSKLVYDRPYPNGKSGACPVDSYHR